MKVARYEVPGMGKKYGSVPEGRLKSGCARHIVLVLVVVLVLERVCW
jgi:hypothetical protein